MAVHYSKPLGFVGRNICYRVSFNGVRYGHIVGGSASRFLPGRDEFFGDSFYLNNVVNNIFFHVEPDRSTKRYPVRNFSQSVLAHFRQRIDRDWKYKYGDNVIGFESLVELPRTGEVYLRDGWIETGVTKGFTCKRTSGEGTDSWSGKRVWNTENLRPKRVFLQRECRSARKANEYGCQQGYAGFA